MTAERLILRRPAVSYAYDNNGNLLNDGVYTYSYDTANRLTQMSSVTATTEYRYNGDGVRIAQIVDGLRTDYAQDIAAPLPQVLAARQGGTVNNYLRGLGLIAEQQGSAVWQYHLPDVLGSVRQLTDPLAQVTLSQSFDPFGVPIIQNLKSQIQNRYGFAGEEQDPDSGQIYLRARTYNPKTGRFLQQDSVIGSPAQPRTLHRYAYAFNNPVNYRDPSGYTGERNNARTPGPQTNYRNQQTDLPVLTGTPGMRMPIPVRSVNTHIHQTFSDPVARQRSQGHRPKPCGVGSFISGMTGSLQRGHLSSDLLMLALNSQPLLRQQMHAAGDWLNWQVDTVRQMWEQRDWRMAASLTFGAGTAFIAAGLVGAFAAAPVAVAVGVAVLTGVDITAANSMFNTALYGGDMRQNLLKDFYSEGAETAFEVAGSTFFGAPGAFVGSVIGAGVGQLISNAQDRRPLTEGLLASMAVSGAFEGVSGAGGYLGGRRFGGALNESNLTATRLRSLDDFIGNSQTVSRSKRLLEDQQRAHILHKLLDGLDESTIEKLNKSNLLRLNLNKKHHQKSFTATELTRLKLIQEELQWLNSQMQYSSKYWQRKHHHHRHLQLATVATLKPDQAVSIRAMDKYVWHWERLGIDTLSFKPTTATETTFELPGKLTGYRETNVGIFRADADPGWAVIGDRLMTNNEFYYNVAPRVKTVMGLLGHRHTPILHGPHMNVEAIFNEARRKLKTKYPNNPNRVAQVMGRFQRRYFGGHDLGFFTQEKYYGADVFIYGRNYSGQTGYLGSGKMKQTLDQYAPNWKTQSGGTVIQYPAQSPEVAYPSDPRVYAVVDYFQEHGRFPTTADEALQYYFEKHGNFLKAR